MSLPNNKLWVIVENEKPTKIEIGIKPTINQVDKLIEATLFENQQEVIDVVMQWPQRKFRILEVILRIKEW